MKKKIILLPLIAMCGLGIGFATTLPALNVVKAEEETTETATSVEETTTSEVATTSEVKEEEPFDEEAFTEKIKSWLSQYFDIKLVSDLVTWLMTSGLMGALFGVYIKYRKYKKNTTEEVLSAVKKEVGKYLEEQFGKLSKEQIDKILNGFTFVEQKMDILMQALVFAQDKTSEGKIALLKLIQSNTSSQEVKDEAEKVEKTLVEEQKANDEVKEVVKEDYAPID